MTKTPLIPTQVVPNLTVPLVGGGHWSLGDQTQNQFTLIVVYRGLHCPICSNYLADLNQKIDEFDNRGVKVLVVSSDGEDRAIQAQEKWGLTHLRVGYGLSLESAMEWGLYVSSGRGKTSAGLKEPSFFPEPGLFLIRPDQTLYFASVQTMPFARPSFGDIVKAIDFVIARNYPARGEVSAIPSD